MHRTDRSIGKTWGRTVRERDSLNFLTLLNSSAYLFPPVPFVSTALFGRKLHARIDNDSYL